MKAQTIRMVEQRVKDKMRTANICYVEIYAELRAIEKLCRWEEADHYIDAPELIDLQKGDFQNYVEYLFGKSMWNRFKKMKSWSGTPGWADRVNKLGYEQMNFLMNRPIEVCKKILNAIDDGDKRQPETIHRSLYGNTIKKEAFDLTKIKIKKIEEKYIAKIKAMEKKLEKSEAEIKELKKLVAYYDKEFLKKTKKEILEN